MKKSLLLVLFIFANIAFVTNCILIMLIGGVLITSNNVSNEQVVLIGLLILLVYPTYKLASRVSK